MNIFLTCFIMTLFYYSLRLIDKNKHENIKQTLSKEEFEKIKKMGVFKKK